MNEQIAIPLFIKGWIDNNQATKLKKYITWLFEVEKNGNRGYKIEELSKMLGYQTSTARELLWMWEEDGLITHRDTEGCSFYYLNPIQDTEALAVPTILLENVLTETKNRELMVWLWLQLNPTTKIQERKLMKLFEYSHKNAIHAIMRELSNVGVLTYERITIDDTIFYELDYPFTVVQFHSTVIPKPILTSDANIETIGIPNKMIKWLLVSEDLLAIKLYCEWLIHLTSVPNYSLNTNELISNVFSSTDYATVQMTLKVMTQLGMVSSEIISNRNCYKLIISDELIYLDFEPFRQAVTELKHKELSLWLSLQLEPIARVKTKDLMDRVRMMSDVQCRNILKRLNATPWLKANKDKGRIYKLTYDVIQIEPEERIDYY